MSHPTEQQVSAKAESARPLRTVASAVAVCLGAFIALEPLAIDTQPGLQIAQAAFVAWFWALFMFGTTSEHRNRQK